MIEQCCSVCLKSNQERPSTCNSRPVTNHFRLPQFSNWSEDFKCATINSNWDLPLRTRIWMISFEVHIRLKRAAWVVSPLAVSLVSPADALIQQDQSAPRTHTTLHSKICWLRHHVNFDDADRALSAKWTPDSFALRSLAEKEPFYREIHGKITIVRRNEGNRGQN